MARRTRTRRSSSPQPVAVSPLIRGRKRVSRRAVETRLEARDSVLKSPAPHGCHPETLGPPCAGLFHCSRHGTCFNGTRRGQGAIWSLVLIPAPFLTRGRDLAGRGEWSGANSSAALCWSAKLPSLQASPQSSPGFSNTRSDDGPAMEPHSAHGKCVAWTIFRVRA